MSTEVPQPTDPFGFAEQERLYNRISDERFRQLLANGQTTIHQVQLSTNSL